MELLKKEQVKLKELRAERALILKRCAVLLTRKPRRVTPSCAQLSCVRPGYHGLERSQLVSTDRVAEGRQRRS